MTGQNRFGIPFGLVGEFTTHVSRDFSGDWDVHWAYDLDFEPWPSGQPRNTLPLSLVGYLTLPSTAGQV